ncbi:MAG: Imm8 family immunity protein [Thermoleophilia bacterium]
MIGAITIEAEIGPPGVDGGDLLQLEAVAPTTLARRGTTGRGRANLILCSCSWEAVDRELLMLLHASVETWQEVDAKLTRELHWEFERYVDRVSA